MSEPVWELLGGGGTVGPSGIDYVGAWAAGTTYQPGQVVRYQGVDYLAVNPSIGQTPPAAQGVPTAALALIQKIGPLGAAAASIDFTAIPATYSHLVLKALIRLSAAVTGRDMLLQMNGDVATSKYAGQRVQGFGTTVSATEVLAGGVAGLDIGAASGASATAGYASQFEIEIIAYTNTSFVKSAYIRNVERDSAATAQMVLRNWGGVWIDTAAINRLTLKDSGGGNLDVGSVAWLYGVV